MDIKRWSWAIVLGGVMAAILAVFATQSLVRDLALPRADLAAESVHIGEDVDYVLDFGRIGPMDKAAYQDLTSRMKNSGGHMPNVGFKFYQGGMLWYRFVVPSLPTSETHWNIRLDDFRVVTARLIVVGETGSFAERIWEYDSPEKLVGVGDRVPIFRFDRDEIEGRTVLVGIANLAALRADAFVETDRLTDANELHEALVTSLLIGGLWSVSVFLFAVGVRARSFTLLAAGGVFLWFGIFGYGAKGYLRAILAPWPDFADTILYGGQPWMMGSFLLLVAAYFGLPRATPKLAAAFFVVAGLLPLQGIMILLIAAGAPFPVLSEFIGPVLVGMLLGIGTILWYGIARRDRRAWWFLACVLPVVITGGTRVATYLGPAPAWILNLTDTFADIVVTMMLLGLLSVFELQRRQQALARTAMINEQRFRSYAEIASDSYFETDDNGLVLSAAGPLVRNLGLVEGMAFAPVLGASAAPDQHDTISRLQQAVAEPQILRDVEVAVLSPQAQRGWISVNVAPWQISPDGRAGLRGTITDITDRVERRERESRQTTLSALGQLASGVAHEVNNLLHPIINLARRVRDRDGQDPESRRLLDLVVSSGQHAGEIVAGVLSAFNPSTIPGTPRPVDDALRDALTAVRATLPATIELRDSIAGGSAVGVMPGEMLQVVSNLLGNAMRAMDGRGIIEVSLAVRADGGALFVFADNGPGMPEQVRRRATEPFVSGRASGTGLGLSIVANIVRKWQGELDIASAPGSGTRITITLPAPTPA